MTRDFSFSYTASFGKDALRNSNTRTNKIRNPEKRQITDGSEIKKLIENHGADGGEAEERAERLVDGGRESAEGRRHCHR